MTTEPIQFSPEDHDTAHVADGKIHLTHRCTGLTERFPVPVGDETILWQCPYCGDKYAIQGTLGKTTISSG